jgi:predicted O-linked N-acetylglucosamine transferase (SPINDLY family)
MLKNLFNRLRPAASGGAPSPVDAPATDDVAAADALILRGNDLEDAGDVAQAEALYRQAAAKAPRHPRAHLNLGIVLAARGDEVGAAKAYETVLAFDPRHPFGNYNFARLLFIRKELARAEALVNEAVQAKPDFPQALVLQASVLEALGKLTQAEQALEAAVRVQPENPGAWFNLAVLRLKLDRHDACEAAAERLLELAPRHPGALALRSRVIREHHFVEEVLTPLSRSVREDPTNVALRSEELMLLNFVEDVSAADMFARHREYGVDVERENPVRFDSFVGARDPRRRLRVGYVSADFYLHPVALFMKPVLESHDRSTFEVFCYSSVQNPDHITEVCRKASDHWRQVDAMSDAELADAIHADAIDILIDLTGHTGSPRLPTFSQRPAPVQAAWVGYLNTTGLTRMDYRLSDVRCDPPEPSQALHTERLVMLPDSQWCYRPFVDSVVSATAPFERNGYVTFGSFNGSMKLTRAMLRRWSTLLLRVPDSRLLIAGLGSPRKRAAIVDEMTRAGIAPTRVDFAPRVALASYPDLISGADIALDTFPYGGGTTTFDTLWMGVPVVATFGETPVSRSAASILEALGLDDWIAPSIDDFVDVAVARAADLANVAALRRSLRPLLQMSPLTDVERFTRSLEEAYREMWIAYCRQ